MLSYEPGCTAVSLAGHDKGTVYLILREETDSVLLTDGRLRPLEKPKKKKKKHVRLAGDTELVREMKDGKMPGNDVIRRVLKQARAKENQTQEDMNV